MVELRVSLFLLGAYMDNDNDLLLQNMKIVLDRFFSNEPTGSTDPVRQIEFLIDLAKERDELRKSLNQQIRPYPYERSVERLKEIRASLLTEIEELKKSLWSLKEEFSNEIEKRALPILDIIDRRIDKRIDSFRDNFKLKFIYDDR